MRIITPGLTLFLLLNASAFGQLFSVGVKGGVPITDSVSSITVPSVDVVTRAFSDSKNYIVGPMLELHLPLGFSVEADGLYRPLNLTTEVTVVPARVTRTYEDVMSWEIPIVAKYRLPFLVVKPYVEAGPSFRHVGSRLSYLSGKGFVVGGGMELKLGRLRVGPEVRYTRWGADAANRAIRQPLSNVDQAEFLIGLSF